MIYLIVWSVPCDSGWLSHRDGGRLRFILSSRGYLIVQRPARRAIFLAANDPNALGSNITRMSVTVNGFAELSFLIKLIVS